MLMINVFFKDYPLEWSKQILHSIRKNGHTRKYPKLRGIAVATFLCRIYDSILNEKFLSWYQPNYEQAGFRSGQGCLNQIFILVLLINHAREHIKKLYICFLDYEKAFDFANRAEISNHLMKKGCGKFLTSAITKTLSTSVYHPKISNNRLGEGIESVHGVTQGRKSSANLFSFYLSDMATAFEYTKYDDFMQLL